MARTRQSEAPEGLPMAESIQVRYEIRGPAAWILLDRPEKRNALSPAMIAQIGAALDRASADDRARAIVLTGREPAFCAGADLGTSQGLAEGAEGSQPPFVNLLRRLQDSAKPVIAAINGSAFGGGLGLVAAADVAIASSTAVFSFSEVRLGLIPAMISVVVLPKIGLHQARRLFLTGRKFSAEEAKSYGLIHHVTPPEELTAAVLEEAEEIAKGGPNAIAEAKRLIREIPKLPEDEAFTKASTWLAERMQSEEAREGMAAFSKKRPPRWRQ